MTAAVEADDDRLLEVLSTVASARTGIRVEAISEERLRDLVRRWLRRGETRERVLARTATSDAELFAALEEAIAVGETFFFRQREHFELLAEEMSAARDRPVRAWSAGCATGEEAYSIAATLGCERGSFDGVSVLATDLVPAALDVARAGVYGARALRSLPPLYPIAKRDAEQRLHVLTELRAVTRFESHNLLDPAPLSDGPFDVILCRNVLVYLTPAAQRTVCANLADALAPGGIALFSPMDVTDAPPGLQRVGAAELQAFRRTAARVSLPPPSRLRTRRSVPPPSRRARQAFAPEDPVGVHVRALAHVERGEREAAQRVLAHLCRTAPAYVPGLLERALLHMRDGERNAAISMMRDVLRRTRRLDPEQTLLGPEPLPVRYYTASVVAFLERLGVRA